MQEEMKTVSFDEKGQALLNGEPLDHVKSYRLEYSAESGEPAELTVTMSVNVG